MGCGGGRAVGVGLARCVRVRAGRRAALAGQLLQLDAALVHAARPLVAAAPGAGADTPPAAPLPALQHSPGHHGFTTGQYHGLTVGRYRSLAMRK